MVVFDSDVVAGEKQNCWSYLHSHFVDEEIETNGILGQP